MRLLITGVCGFAGSALAASLLERRDGLTVIGIDNLSRPGSEANRLSAQRLGVKFHHADIRCASDFENLPAVDWVIDAAASPSILAGVTPGSSSRQLFEHNLGAQVNVLEYAKRHGAGVVLLSTSRVYSIAALNGLPLKTAGQRCALDGPAKGIGPDFPTTAPISLYGATKLASEAMTLEYGDAFGFPVWVDRCGVLAGPGQFGTAAQGIFSYWIHSHFRRRPLKFIGFEGAGKQVRDALDPADLAALIDRQMASGRPGGQRIYTAGGGAENSMSLAELHAFCDRRFGSHPVSSDPAPRPYDAPWIVMDSSDAERDFGWRVEMRITAILEQIAEHAVAHPEWLELSGC